MSVDLPPEAAHERFARQMRRLHAEHAAGEGSRAVTLTAPQLTLMGELLRDVEGDVADSLRLVLGIPAGQKPADMYVFSDMQCRGR
ncbi:hypothetical protein [Streptomyces paludis]|uniref:hypothetical protein n=1 Tax=Streptomyces paludis TaxID=2282738 RepID=UPI0013B3891F|nr:hypothetical protein [Streptomyces paludis]